MRRVLSKSFARDGPEDDRQNGDDHGRQERDPERTPEQQLAHVRLADPDRAEWRLRAQIVVVVVSRSAENEENEEMKSGGGHSPSRKVP